MNTEGNFKALEKTIQPYKVLLSKAADAILDQDVSNYPIFAVSSAELNLGLPIVKGGEANADPLWINATTLEELATKNIVEMSKVDNFRTVYKDPRDFFCLFLVEQGTAQFVFLPKD